MCNLIKIIFLSFGNKNLDLIAYLYMNITVQITIYHNCLWSCHLWLSCARILTLIDFSLFLGIWFIQSTPINSIFHLWDQSRPSSSTTQRFLKLVLSIERTYMFSFTASRAPSFISFLNLLFKPQLIPFHLSPCLSTRPLF